MIAKRVLDLILALIGLVVLSPLMLLIAACVSLDSPGPVLFRHRRVGLHGRPFEVMKFRTMTSTGTLPGPEITAAGDQRITRVGRWLRASKLDELPQLFNVLYGEMSLVGPRPEVERYVRMYPDLVRSELLSVRPGITDLASIEFRDEQVILAASQDPEATYVGEILPRKLELCRKYVRERSFGYDLMILLRTLIVVVFRRP